jgi:hypothetical protein
MLRAWMVCGLLVSGMAEAAPIAATLNANMTRYRVNTATNSELALVSNPFQSDSLARSPAGALYSIDPGGVIWNVTMVPIPAGPTSRSMVADLVYGGGGLWGYSNASQEVFFFDLGLGTVTYSQVISGTGAHTITGVAYEASTGDLYLSGNTGPNTDTLFHVPSAASAAATVGAMNNGDGVSYFSDIEFDATGTLYAMSWYHRWFYSVSTATAATTFISAGPHRDVTAMALVLVVPEPASLVCVVCAGVMFRRSRRAHPGQARG